MESEAVVLDYGREHPTGLSGAGVIHRGLPTIKKLEIGITVNAQQADKRDQTSDHLFRVTQTADYLLSRASQMTIEKIEDCLLERSITMRTTRHENNHVLKRALAQCKNKDDWRELYKKAGVEYVLYEQE